MHFYLGAFLRVNTIINVLHKDFLYEDSFFSSPELKAQVMYKFVNGPALVYQSSIIVIVHPPSISLKSFGQF